MVMVTAGLKYLSGHFIPQYKPWLQDRRTCCMLRGGQELHSQTDYILGTDQRLLQNVVVRDACHNR